MPDWLDEIAKNSGRFGTGGMTQKPLFGSARRGMSARSGSANFGGRDHRVQNYSRSNAPSGNSALPIGGGNNIVFAQPSRGTNYSGGGGGGNVPQQEVSVLNVFNYLILKSPVSGSELVGQLGNVKLTSDKTIKSQFKYLQSIPILIKAIEL